MHAVIDTGGKQLLVRSGDTIELEGTDREVGQEVQRAKPLSIDLGLVGLAPDSPSPRQRTFYRMIEAAPARTAFGGVPISVATPPIDAP